METLLIVGLFIALGLTFYRLSGSIRFPGTIAVVLFGVMYVWNRWGPITYPYEFEARHAAYLLLTLFVFGSAMLLGMRSRRQRAVECPIKEIDEGQAAAIARVSMLVGLAGGMMFAMDTYANLGGGDALIQSALAEIRDQFQARTTTWLGAIGSFLMGAALPGTILGLRAWLRPPPEGSRPRFLLPLLLTTVAVLNLVGVLTGGRQMAFASVVTLGGVSLYGGWRSFSETRRRRFLAAGLLVSMLAGGYVLAVINSRAAGYQTTTYFLSLFQNGEAEWFQPRSPDVPDHVYTPLVILSDYFPYNLTSLAVYIDDLDYSRLGWGRVQGVHVLRQLQRIGITFSSDYGVLKTTNLFINAPTGVGMMIADFGLVGALLIYCWWGWLLGKRFYDSTSGQSIVGYLFCVIGLLWIMQSHMSSPLQEVYPFYGMLWSLALVWWFGTRSGVPDGLAAVACDDRPA